nr:hypothetical protein BaRGS_022231 [Batillaria attramentaria]
MCMTVFSGISYLTPQQEEVMREALNTKHQQFAKFSSPAFVSPDTADMGPGKGPVQVPEEQKAFISSVCEKIGTFVDKSGGDDVLQLDPCNGFQRKLIYQTIRSQFSSVHLETRTGEKKERFIVVTRVASEEELKKKEKDKQNAEIMELEEAVGFAKVMKLISQSEVISNTSLEELRKSLDKKPFTPAKVELAEEFKRYENATEMYHEAGYDAFVTGCLFATMANYLGTFQDPVQPVVLPSSKLVEPFVNKLFLMRIADIPYMNLTGSDLDPNRDHVFHITFPKEWRKRASADIDSVYSWTNKKRKSADEE